MSSVRVFGHYIRLSLLLLAIVEGLLLLTSFIIATEVRWWTIDRPMPLPFWELVASGMLVGTVLLVALASLGLYETSVREGWTGSILRIVLAIFFGSAMLGAISFFFRGLDFWRSVLAINAVISFVAIGGLRSAAYFVNPTIFRRHVLVVGDGPVAQELTRVGRRSLAFVGVVIPSRGANGEDAAAGVAQERRLGKLPVLDASESLSELVARHDADEIVLALSDRRGRLPMEALLDCRMSGIRVLDALTFYERELGLVKLDLLTASWLLHDGGFGQGAMTRLVKRGMDLSLSSIMLVVMSPLMALAGLAVWIEGRFREPIFHHQTRIGANGKAFRITKFRSMVCDAEADGRARWAVKNDPRVTRVGAVMRKTRIDELPQLVSVLKGDMSFVGPRPERPQFVVDLIQTSPYYAVRHRVKPGLTGWAQLRFPYGSSEEDALRKLEYDLYYVKNYSIFLDLLIIIQTVEVVLFGKGAV
ncbi:sugar transferase, PEP-CTERM system associated [Thiorhodococcus drewsii AZ1]|uniref:Sugar transferase, PEP-CTERM system associated n=1 Tax=Thiorhodococcus drewsii AZ1 TaxID=765913 RepID=G2E7W9_9GAMM|nr:TIGR03013 family XrtA/PEP-CTERM system glycosyltransferase [Thiorhodococcus drewsii]EGV27809.1 sugar transferase, PEP-CTERM system associated [Thiorhodococcus drewsii AZ1]